MRKFGFGLIHRLAKILNSFSPVDFHRVHRIDQLETLMTINKPLVVVLGCTGAGKSDLGIAIAKHFSGEVISADSMQIYKGLDIATNKVTESEMDGVPHHLMSFVEPSTSTYNVHKFKSQAMAIIEKLWDRGKLPVVVGGTGYYVESLIFDDYLLPTRTNDTKEEFSEMSNDEVYEYLKSVDPGSAAQIHKNNRFRVERALQIYNATGRRKSELLNEQHARLSSSSARKLRYPNLFIFFADADKAVLEQRLSDRVQKMIDRGLRKEIEQFYDRYRCHISAHGVAQSIAIKEFFDYLKLSLPERYSPIGDQLFLAGCEALKLHTRQYAKMQRRWMKNHFLCKSTDKPANVEFVDTSSLFRTVIGNSLDKVAIFLTGLQTETSECGDVENNVSINVDLDYRKLANQIYHCDVCNRDIQGEITWNAHLKGKRHRKMLSLQRKTKSDDHFEKASSATQL